MGPVRLHCLQRLGSLIPVELIGVPSRLTVTNTGHGAPDVLATATTPDTRTTPVDRGVIGTFV